VLRCAVCRRSPTHRLRTTHRRWLLDSRCLLNVLNAAGTGGLRLLSAAGLSGLLQLLSDRDMPVDMLQLLVYMAEDGCRCVQGSHSGGHVSHV
jgi:hypothetical protein